jgi:hypothetical protein
VSVTPSTGAAAGQEDASDLHREVDQRGQQLLLVMLCRGAAEASCCCCRRRVLCRGVAVSGQLLLFLRHGDPCWTSMHSTDLGLFVAASPSLFPPASSPASSRHSSRAPFPSCVCSLSTRSSSAT